MYLRKTRPALSITPDGVASMATQPRSEPPSPRALSPTNSSVSGLTTSQSKAPRIASEPRNLADAEKARIVEDPELREYAMRETMREWAAFFASENFSKEKEDMLVKLLVDRTLVINMAERVAFDDLAAQLLTAEELQRFTAFRDDLPIKNSVAEATRRMEKELGAQLEPGIRSTAESVVRSAPLNHDSIWQSASDSLVAGRLTVADLAQIEALARQKFELSLQQNASGLTGEQRAALRRWFEQGPLAFNMRALNNGLKARQ